MECLYNSGFKDEHSNCLAQKASLIVLYVEDASTDVLLQGSFQRKLLDC